MRRTQSTMLALAFLLWSGNLWAYTCPSNLVDTLVPNSYAGSDLPVNGLSIDSSDQWGGSEYVLSMVSPLGSNPVNLYRFALNGHAQAGSVATVSQDYPNKCVETASNYANGQGRWVSSWGYDGTTFSNFYYDRYLSSDFSMPLPSAGVGFESDTEISVSMDSLAGSNGFVVAAIARDEMGAGLNRPRVRILDSTGEPNGAPILIAENDTWTATSVAVDSWRNDSQIAQFVVAWSERSMATGRSRIAYRVYYALGQPVQAAYYPIYASSGRRVDNVWVAAVGGAVVLVWDDYSMTSRLNSDAYMQGFSEYFGSTTFAKRLIELEDYYATCTPDVSAIKWNDGTGNYHSVYSVSFDRILPNCPSAGASCRFPMVKLFRDTSSPVDVTGTQWLSWYPHSATNPKFDGPKTEVFAYGCQGKVVVSGTAYVDANPVAIAQRGLRRSFFSVESSSLLYEANLMTADGALSEPAYANESEPGDCANEFAALQNGGVIVSNGLNSVDSEWSCAGSNYDAWGSVL